MPCIVQEIKPNHHRMINVGNVYTIAVQLLFLASCNWQLLIRETERTEHVRWILQSRLQNEISFIWRTRC